MSRSFGEKSCTISTARSTGLGHGDAVKLGETRGSVDNGDRWSEQAAASSAPATTALARNARRIPFTSRIAPRDGEGAQVPGRKRRSWFAKAERKPCHILAQMLSHSNIGIGQRLVPTSSLNLGSSLKSRHHQ